MLLRGYQKRIVNQVGSQNAIVLLPTGSGKTLIGSEILKQYICNQTGVHSLSALFIVPSRVLVAQQAQAIREWTQLEIGEYMGGISFPNNFDILVSTPQAFLSKQRKLDKLHWSHIGIVIFDEVHHVLKDHPYRKIAHQIPESVQIIGLTASLTYGVTEKAVNKTVQRFAYELRIKVLATATIQELQKDGYHGNVTKAETQTLLHQTRGTIPLNERKPHLMYDMFWSRYRKNQLTSHAKCIVDIIHALEEKAKVNFIGFKSPLKQRKLANWGAYAHRAGLYFLEHWYESLRMIVMNWEESQGLELAVSYLKMMHIDTYKLQSNRFIIDKINAFFATYGNSCAKMDGLKKTLLVKQKEAASDLRALVFVQQKVAVHIIVHFISNDNELTAKGFKAVPLYSSSTKPPTSSLSLSKKESERYLDDFAEGRANILVCTTVAEEGIDVAAANCVIRFDSILNSVSFVQGRGRARQKDSSFVIMSEEKGRTVDKLESIEKLQSAISAKFDEVKVDSAEFIEKQRVAQNSRERNAKKILVKWKNIRYKSLSLSLMQQFCQRTKVVLRDKYLKANNGYVYMLEYRSCLRTVSSKGFAQSKKGAKKKATSNMLNVLCKQICMFP